MSTPMFGASLPALAVMPAAAFPVSSEGWPRPLAGRESADNTPPWKDRDMDDVSDSLEMGGGAGPGELPCPLLGMCNDRLSDTAVRQAAVDSAPV